MAKAGRPRTIRSNDPKTAAELAIEKAGGRAELARKLGITLQAVTLWDRQKRIPTGRVIDVERISGIHRTILRPDIYPS